MRNTKVILTAALVAGMFTTTSYAGQSFSSPAFVQQASGSASGIALLDTASIFKPSMDVIAASRPSQTPSDLVGNLSLVYQSGDFNTASIEQAGSGNVGLIQQIGYMNSASISQTGVGHQGFIAQQGRNNVAIIRQR